MSKVKRAVMIFVFFLSGVLSGRSCWADGNVIFSDTNFINSFRNASGDYQAYDYNRLRSELDLRNPTGTLRGNAILDFESYISRPFIKSSVYQSIKDPDPDLPFNPYLPSFESDDAMGRFYLYRLNAEAEFKDSNLVLGLQRIPFGVGRMWNPTDTFNPVDALSVEPEERLGVFAVDYNRHLSDFSSLQVISNFKKKGALDKYGFRYKGHHFGMDMGVSFIQNTDFLMTGAEWESNIFSTGIEARSELGFFNDDNLDRSYFSGMAGLEYGFASNVTVLGEYFYNGLGSEDKADYNIGNLINGNWNLGRHYLGAEITYDLTPLTTVSFSSICNLLDGSYFSGPSLQYSINDETNISFGANIYTGNSGSEFGGFYDDLYYVKWESYF